jgi:aminoglycoside phosphotransferase (APT) family kinase protein
MQGFYNTNTVVDGPAGRVVVRVPRGCVSSMDLRIWPEEHVLAAIAPYVPRAPRLLFASTSPRFQLHEYVDGVPLPPSGPLPAGVTAQLGEFFESLAAVPATALPPLPEGWPADGDCVGFAHRLADLVDVIFLGTHRRGLLHLVHVPDKPLDAVRDRFAGLAPRGFALVHADVHRGNVLVEARRGVVVIDWELALFGDPRYDLAVHAHRSLLAPPDDAGVRRYVALERVKSAIVDTIRAAELVDAGVPPAVAVVRTDLVTKLDAAYAIWGVPALAEPDRVAALLTPR